jgi:hypothetical protein
MPRDETTPAGLDALRQALEPLAGLVGLDVEADEEWAFLVRALTNHTATLDALAAVEGDEPIYRFDPRWT